MFRNSCLSTAFAIAVGCSFATAAHADNGATTVNVVPPSGPTAADQGTQSNTTGAAASSTAPAPDKSGYTLFNPTPDSQMRSFSTDRPNKSNSPYTVDAGHFQYETDLFGTSYDGYSSGHTQTRELFTADPVFKVGITNNVDLEVGLGGYQDFRIKQRNAGPANVVDGTGNITLRAKVNMWGNDGGKTAFALIPYVTLPTASRGLGGNQVQGGLIAPFQITLPYGFTAIFEPEMDELQNNVNDGDHVAFTNLVNISYPLTDKLTASAEFYSQLQTANNPNTYTLDLSLAYLLGPNTQIDTAVYEGLTKASPDIVGYVGLSQRF